MIFCNPAPDNINLSASGLKIKGRKNNNRGRNNEEMIDSFLFYGLSPL